jgi:beta-barrel assembly-enhancing protease
MSHPAAWFVILLSLAPVGAGCSSQTAAEILVSPEEENKLGAALKMELESKQMVKYLQDPALRAYVLGLANRVVDLGKTDRPEFTWAVEVIDDPNQVNAFATPGGYLYVYTGLLRAAESEAEVIGVMGHEVGHVLARHYARRLVKTYGLQVLAQAALGSNPGVLAELAASIAANGYLLSHSRDDETESDEIGARLARRAGYDPQGLVTFFEKLDAMQGSVPSILKYLMGHPPPADRSAHVRALIAKEMLGGGATNSQMFQQMKAKLPAPAPTGDAGVRD